MSINVPDDKAKAVIDAMEREMMGKLATKADLAHAQELLSRDLQGLAEKTEIRMQGLATKVELSEFAGKLTAQTYLAVGGCAVFTCSVLGTLLVLLR